MAVINAITGSNADIQDACNAASDGDTVLIPSGTFACEGTITIQDKNLHIRGDSKTTTILERNVESSSKSMFYVPMIRMDLMEP